MKVLPIVCTNNYEAKLFAAAFSVAFFYGYFRVSEITEGRKQLGGHAVELKNLEISNEQTFLKFYLQHSKLTKRGKGETIVIENNKSSTLIKPVDIMLGYSRVRRSVLSNSGDLLLWVGVRCRATCLVRKHLLLDNYWATLNQIWYEASVG